MDEISLLRKLVSINSVFPNERVICEFVETLLIEQGFSTQRIAIAPNRFNVVGERGTRGKPILFYGHLDTVPPYGQWEGDPFTLREEGDKLHGLGAVDMKAGVAAILKAVEEKTDRRIKVVFGVDEENISEGSNEVLKNGFLDDAEVGICTEIATSENQRFGPQAITLGRRGRCVLEISVPGSSFHGAQNSRGINAISEASRLVIELEQLNGSLGTHELLPPSTQFIRRISSESTSLSVPDNAIIELDRHMVAPETPETVLKDTNRFISRLYADGIFREIDGKRITVILKERKTPYLAPYVTSKDNPYVQMLSTIIRESIGEPIYNYGASVADENALAKAVPMISIAPAGNREHASNEWVSKSSYLQLIDILKTFLRSC
jgi:succinyl-diaminopimelate desuccinylase